MPSVCQAIRHQSTNAIAKKPHLYVLRTNMPIRNMVAQSMTRPMVNRMVAQPTPLSSSSANQMSEKLRK